MQLDNKRGNYLLKETSLAKTLCLACRFDPKTPSGQAAIKYKEGRNAGFFAKTMREVRQAFGVGPPSVKGVHSLGCDSRDGASAAPLLESTASCRRVRMCAAMAD